MKKTLLTALLGVGLVFGCGREVRGQENPYFNEKYKSYFDVVNSSSTGLMYTNLNVPSTIYNYLVSRLTDKPKEDGVGMVWIQYYDTNNDKFYDYVIIRKYNGLHNIGMFEKFAFHTNEKQIDYTLEIYKNCEKTLEDCENIISKKYERISIEEAHSIGEDFVNRINKIVTSQNDFNRFNTEPIDKLLREEANTWKTKYIDGKYKLVNFGFPIYKYLSEEEISKIEEAISD